MNSKDLVLVDAVENLLSKFDMECSPDVLAFSIVFNGNSNDLQQVKSALKEFKNNGSK